MLCGAPAAPLHARTAGAPGGAIARALPGLACRTASGVRGKPLRVSMVRPRGNTACGLHVA
jgi:hypothetical protein